MSQVVIVGSGAWGIALALTAYRTGASVSVIGYDTAEVDRLKESRRSPAYPHVSLPEGIQFTTSLVPLEEAQLIVLVPPAQVFRGYLPSIAEGIPSTTPLLIASKGIDVETGELLSTIVSQVLPNNPVGVLSGPNLAVEVAQGLPSVATMAYKTSVDVESIRRLLVSENFIIQISDDCVGVQVAGSVKNVVAIACGLAHGYDMGKNAQAALIAQGLREVQRLGVTIGARPETFFSYAGVGDMILSCTRLELRNFRFGYLLSQLKNPHEALEKMHNTVEGYFTARGVEVLSQRYQVPMPLCHSIYRLLYEKERVHDVGEMLMRALRS